MAYSVSRLGGAEPTVDLVAQMERDEYGKKSSTHSRNLTPSTPAGRGKKAGGDLVIYDPSSRNTSTSTLDVDLLETYGGTPKVNRGERKRMGGVELTPSRSQYENGSESFDKSSHAVTPLRATFSPASFSPSTATPSAAYSGRSNAGQLVCSHNASEVAVWEWEAGTTSFHPTVEELLREQVGSSKLRYMCDFVGEVSQKLEAHLMRMVKWLIQEGGLEPWMPEPLDMPQRSSQNYLGRICSDGRLNVESILLEGAVDSTVSGKPIRLDVSGVSSSEGSRDPYALFPGQVVVVNGQNRKGQRLYAQQIYSKASAPLPPKAPSISTHTGPLRVVVGAGPFTQLDTLSYEPLQDLMALVRQIHPHVLVLIGPFLEFGHTHVSGDGGCQLAETFEAYFDRMLDEMMGQLQGMAIQVVLVSSARDVHAHPVYPTPAYAFPSGGRAAQYLGNVSDGTKRPRLILAPDPCLLDISGVVIGVTATDILMHLGREEMASAGHKIDRLGRLSRHLIHQRNFYPLYPPAPGLNLDMKLWSEMCCMPVTPHILILPSDLRGFIKGVDGCLVMNPERLTKGVVGGSFAKFEVRPCETWEPSLLSNVWAQIVKI